MDEEKSIRELISQFESVVRTVDKIRGHVENMQTLKRFDHVMSFKTAISTDGKQKKVVR
jgi:hypothetical protein